MRALLAVVLLAGLLIWDVVCLLLCFKDCYEFECDYAQYIGELCRYLLNTPPGEYDRLHQVNIICGNGMRPDVWTEFTERFHVAHVREFYGMQLPLEAM